MEKQKNINSLSLVVGSLYLYEIRKGQKIKIKYIGICKKNKTCKCVFKNLDSKEGIGGSTVRIKQLSWRLGKLKLV